jgi:uncharacterized protein (TIGR00299 family) protein
MKYAFFDGASGLSGDMILGALIDLGVEPALFADRMGGLRLPADIAVRRVRRSGLAALKVKVEVRTTHAVERTFRDVEKVIMRSRFASPVKDRAVAVFKRLFQAEARVHGRSFGKTHLHEAGADDALIDVVGFSWLAETLDIGEFQASPLNVGSGWVKTAHGVLPVPPPAVADLLRGVPVFSAWVDAELVTPTGAAVVATMVKTFTKLPELVYDRIGRGAGSRDFPDFPNVLRVFYGDAATVRPAKRVFVIEATLDDATPQLLAHFLETALETGALDATLEPVVMKKNRLGTKLTVLAPADKIDPLIEAVFRETTSIGVRYFPVERRVLGRDFRTVRVGGRRVAIKVGSIGGRIVNVQPEYDDCLEAARATGRPVKEIVQMAVRAYDRKR